MRRYGILLKGGFPPGSIRVWGGVKYRKFGPGDWRPLVDKKEPWDSSSRKAGELTIADFGSPEEVREMAAPVRVAKNRQEALVILKDIRKHGEMINKRDTELRATLSGDSMSKIVSDRALYSSFDQNVHWQAVANIDKLFSNAIEPWKFELNPEKNNQDLKERRILYAPLEYQGKLLPVKLTVKEFKDKERGIRLYSVEAIDVIIGTKK
jgi:hypothetical protein